MAWYPKLRRRPEARAADMERGASAADMERGAPVADADDETGDPVLAPEDLDDEEGAQETDTDSVALAQQVQALTEQVADLGAQCAQASAHIEALRAQNEQLQADLGSAQAAQAAAQEDGLKKAQLSAHAAAVRAFGQGSAKLAAAEGDIDACESEREARSLQRAYEAATPSGLARSERQTLSQDPATAGRTSAQVKNGALTPEQKAAHQRDMASRF